MAAYAKQTLAERKAYHALVNEGFICVTVEGPQSCATLPINHPIFPLVVTPHVGPTGTLMAQTFYYLATIGVHDRMSWPELGCMFGITTGESGTYGVQHALCNAFYRMMYYLNFDLEYGYLFVPDHLPVDVRRMKGKWSVINDAAWEVWMKQ